MQAFKNRKEYEILTSNCHLKNSSGWIFRKLKCYGCFVFNRTFIHQTSIQQKEQRIPQKKIFGEKDRKRSDTDEKTPDLLTVFYNFFKGTKHF